MFDFNLPEPSLWYTKIIMQLWTNPGRENKVFSNCQFESVTWRSTSYWTICHNYLPFIDEVTRSIRSGGQDRYTSIQHYALLRPPEAIQALRPPVDQLKSGDCLRIWDVIARFIFPSVKTWHFLLAVAARILIHRTPSRITEAPQLHPSPSFTSYSTFEASSSPSFSSRNREVDCRCCVSGWSRSRLKSLPCPKSRRWRHPPE